MSSSSSATETVAGLLDESFRVLADELPEAHARMAAALGGRAVRLRVDDEDFTVRFDGGVARVDAAPGPADIEIGTTKAVIDDVLEARRTLADAVLADAVTAVAPLPVLVEAHRGLLAYVHGAVRSPSFPRLLERFRALCAASAGGEGSR